MKYQWFGVLILAGWAMVGCEGGKQGAILAMDEARLNIAAAEKAGAVQFAGKSLNQAKNYMASAEKKMSQKEYGTAKAIAAQASSEALSATLEAKDNAARIAALAKKTPAPRKPVAKSFKKQKAK